MHDFAGFATLDLAEEECVHGGCKEIVMDHVFEVGEDVFELADGQVGQYFSE